MSSAAVAIPRTAYLGGSDAAAVLGISNWRTRYMLWCEKMGTEPAPDLSKIDYVYFGTLLEPVVARVFQERSGLKVRESAALRQHPKHPFIAGHIDRMVTGQRAFLECKTANAFDMSKWGKSTEGLLDTPEAIPDYYLAQCDHYLMLLDYDFCYLAVLVGGNDFRWYRINRNAKREAHLLREELAFWDLVQTQQPPDIRTEADARHRWKQVLEGTAVPVDGSVRQKVLRLSQVHEQAAVLEKEEKKLRNEVIPLFQDRELLSHNGEPIARLAQFSQNRFDLDLFREKHKKLAKKFTKPNTAKRFSTLI